MEKEEQTVKDRETAYFRFALIAPVIQGTFTDPSVAAYCRRIAKSPVKRPDGVMFQYRPATLNRWINAYNAGGMDALMPQERSDKGSVKCLSDECILEIFRLKEKFPRLNGVQIHSRLLSEGLIDAFVSVRTVQRFLKAKNLKSMAASGAMKDRKAFEEPFFGACWQADTCYLPYVHDETGKRRTYLIAIIDDHSRMCVGAELFFEDSAYNFQKVFKNAVAAHGIPQKIFCDHGSAYDNAQLAFICGSIGTLLLHAPVRDGAAKGKIERMFGTLKSRWLSGLDISQIRSLSEFNSELAEAVRKHNLSVNSSTGQSPMDRFLSSREHIPMPRSAQWLEECFMNRIIRKVRNDSTLSLFKMQFDAPMQFIRQSVEVRFLPGYLDEAYIYDQGRHYLLKRTDKQANSRAKRENPVTVDYSRAGDQGV
jgi:transposase InsO family protein